ncbi:MAG: hypothetical protein VCD00_12615 [Candidatus Hydrogenedentota bacterium]
MPEPPFLRHNYLARVSVLPLGIAVMNIIMHSYTMRDFLHESAFAHAIRWVDLTGYLHPDDDATTGSSR